MDDLVERLRGFEGSDDLGNGDFAVCTQAADRITELESRLEVVQGLSADCDGIACRDETIRLQDIRIKALEARIAELQPVNARWSIGAKVRKKRGSSWRGTVVGYYSTPHTPIGYCVDSAFEPGSCQLWPDAALEDWGDD